MLRTIIPIILIIISIGGVFVFVNPRYVEVKAISAEASAYKEALNNAIKLEKERDKLTSKYNSITKENLNKLQKLLPDSVDNIRLILEIEKLASTYGMTLNDVKYDAKQDIKKTNTQNSSPEVDKSGNKSYGVWDLEFSTEGSYADFLAFTRELENNLRIVDISSIQFSSESGDKKVFGSENYKYTFKIKTYWLKN